MARPRKDGRPAASAVRIGKRRTSAAGKVWQVRAYEPTPGAPFGRVVYRNPATDKATGSVPDVNETLDEVFDRIERWLDQGVAVSKAPAPIAGLSDADAVPGRRDISALSALYLAWLETRGRDDDYIENRRCLIRKWVLPEIGKVLVADWGVEESTRVIEHARPHISPSRLNDLGSTLSGMRNTAHRKRAGGRWLSPDENPLEEVEYGRSSGRQGASSKWVPPHRRPATEMVLKAVAAAEEVGRWPWLADAISVSGFCATRQGEMLGLRAVDVDLREHNLEINGAWATRRSGQRAGRGKTRVGVRKPHPKNRMWRTTPFVGSLHEPLRRRVAVALGLAEDTPVEELAQRIDAERARRAALTSSGHWEDAHVPLTEEAWLFASEDGLPPSREQFNDAWHVVRDAVGWNPTIPFRNLRHHAALWWKANIKDIEWATIADWDGHDVRTLQAYYVIASEDATTRARAQLDAL